MKCKLFILFGHGRFYKDVFGLTSVLSVYTIGEREQRKTDKRHDRQTDKMGTQQRRPDKTHDRQGCEGDSVNKNEQET